ncbi:MAG: FHA domain-containing protein [Chloroflexota bacterium]
MRRGPQQGAIFPLKADTIDIGRGSKNDIIIHDNEVSREHARLVRVAGGFELHDLSSSNGTYVNGQSVDGVWVLQVQSIVELGDSITFEYQPGEPDEDTGDETQDFVGPGLGQTYLVVNTASQEEPAVYPLDGMVIRIGRSTACDIVVIEPEISREHFQLTLSQTGYVIEDLGSTNGTMVNNAFLEGPQVLTTNDIIQIGKTINFQLTETPDVFASLIRTTLLIDTKKLPGAPPDNNYNNRRRTRETELPAGIQTAQPAPSEIGTGLDELSLVDQVLVTYARADWGRAVAPLMDALMHEKVDTWVDQYLIEGSTDWVIATEQARLECWLLIVVVTPAAMRSDLVKKNWRHFHNREKPIILFIQEPVERMPIGARKLTRIQYNPAVPEAAYRQLVAEVNRLRRDKKQD